MAALKLKWTCNCAWQSCCFSWIPLPCHLWDNYFTAPSSSSKTLAAFFLPLVLRLHRGPKSSKGSSLICPSPNLQTYLHLQPSLQLLPVRQSFMSMWLWTSSLLAKTDCFGCLSLSAAPSASLSHRVKSNLPPADTSQSSFWKKYLPLNIRITYLLPSLVNAHICIL